MILRILLLVAAFAALELFLLLKIGAAIGPAPTFVLLLLSGVIGAWLAKRQGVVVVRELGQDLERGLPPGERVMEGALVVLGGLLLVAPGVLSDLVGVLLVLPPTRRWLAPRALRWLTARFRGGGALPEDVPFADDGVRRRGPEPASRRQERRPTPFGTPFDDLP